MPSDRVSLKDNSVLIIVIVSTVIVFAFGQLSNQLELELFVDRMVSAGTKTSLSPEVPSVVVINFLLNSGFFGLRRNLNVPVSFGNHQQEGIVGMIRIAISVKRRKYQRSDNNLAGTRNGTGATTLNDGFRGLHWHPCRYSCIQNARKRCCYHRNVQPFITSRTSWQAIWHWQTRC